MGALVTDVTEVVMYTCVFTWSLPAIQGDLTRVQLDVFLFIKDAVDDGFQHLVQIWHANSLTAKQHQQQQQQHTSISLTSVLQAVRLHVSFTDHRGMFATK